MMINHTLERLLELRLSGMAAALRQQLETPEADELSFEERLDLLLERELTERANRRLATRLKQATLRQSASLRELDYRKSRGLDKRLALELSGCAWIAKAHNVIITGPTGVGKSFIACALAHQACLEGYSAQYHRLSQLLEDLQIGHGDGRYRKLMKQLSRVDVLLLDDWGLMRLSTPQQSDLLELLDERHRRRSTIVTSQVPVEQWHQTMSDPTLADAILDRLVHTAHHIKLKGDSMRKQMANLHINDGVTT